MSFFKYFPAVFFLISTCLFALPEQTDITQEFCKVTKTPDATCAQLQAFMEEYGSYVRVDLRQKVEQKDIGYVGLTKREDVIEIWGLRVNDEFQKQKHGSRLLQFALALCDNKCDHLELYAYPFTAPAHEQAQSFEKLKKFYVSHGAYVKSQKSNVSAEMVFPKNRYQEKQQLMHILMSCV